MEPQAGPTMGARDRVVGLAKRLKDQLQRLRRNPHAGVADANLYALRIPLRRDRNAARFGKLYRIADEILEHDLELAGVGVQQGEVPFYLLDKVERGLFLYALRFRLDLFQQRGQLHGLDR
jgi:hypothetical protein